MQVHTVRCFGAAPGYGNLALVIENGPEQITARQAFARDQGAAASVFITPTAGDATWNADFYYPHARSPLCLHASLAAAHVLCHAQAGRAVFLSSAMRSQLIALFQHDGATFATVRKHAVAPIGIAAGLAQQLLGEPDLILASRPLLSSVGSPKLLIEVADSAALHTLQPPLERIAQWSADHGVNGCYVYCRLGVDLYEGRNFNHLDPAREDCATGVAAGALSAYLGRSLNLLQGERLGNPCRIATRFRGSHIDVGGATELIGT